MVPFDVQTNIQPIIIRNSISVTIAVKYVLSPIKGVIAHRKGDRSTSLVQEVGRYTIAFGKLIFFEFIFNSKYDRLRVLP